MGRLVGVMARGGSRFPAVLEEVWDRQDAVLPVDPRLPAPARDVLLASARPATVVDPTDPLAPPLYDDPGAPPVSAGDALVVASSGTTGPPKLVVHTNESLRAHAEAVHSRLQVEPGDRWLACLPLAHLGGLNVVIRAVIGGVALDVHDGFDPAAVEVAVAGGATLTSLVPTAMDRVDCSGFRWVLLGGAADPTRSRPANVVRTWGLTETCGGIVYDGTPLPGVEVAEVDGELWVRGPTLARGLRLAGGEVSDLRRARPDDPTSPGWIATGDRGTVGLDGTVTVLGRIDDMIVTGGENVTPEVVEAVLGRDPAIAEVAVAGRDDPEWGQRVEAWIVVRSPRPAPSLTDLQARVRAELPPWCAPRAMHVVEALPRTALGKVQRRRLVRPEPTGTTEEVTGG